MKKKNKVESITLPYFESYYNRSNTNQDSVVLMEKTLRSMEQKRLSRSSPHKYEQLISDKVAKSNSTDNSKEMNLKLYFTFYEKAKRKRKTKLKIDHRSKCKAENYKT